MKFAFKSICKNFDMFPKANIFLKVLKKLVDNNYLLCDRNRDI